MNPPSVHIITLNWNGLDDTLECLASLAELTYPSVKVIVVDNASRDSQADQIEQQYPEAVVLKQTENLGFCGGCNVGIEYAMANGADYVMLLNNDTLVPPDLIDKLMSGIDGLSNAGAISPIILEYPDTEKVWFSNARWVPSEAQFRLAADGESYSDLADKEPYASEFACGCCMLISAKALRTVGLLDERYFAFYDEADWCSRAKRIGLRSYVIPSAVMYHKVSRSTPGLVSTYLLTRNRLLWMKESQSFAKRLNSFWYLTKEFAWHAFNLLGVTKNLYSKQHSRAVTRGYKDYFLRRFNKWDRKAEKILFAAQPESETTKLLIQSTRVEHRLPENFDPLDEEDFKSELHYDTYDSYLERFGSAMVSPRSIVYQQWALRDETLFSDEHKTYYRSRHLVKNLLTGKRIRLSDKNSYLLGTDPESTGHFHWLTEVLPKLWALRELTNDFVLLLPDHYYIRTIGLASIEYLGIRFKDIVFMKGNEFYSVRNLFHISRIARSGHMHPQLMQEIRSKFVDGKKVGTRKIYISRDRARVRKVLNEVELTAILKGNGFDILIGEELSFSEQVDIFSQCETLVGLHGAGLTNCLMMKPGRIIELKKKESNVGYWHLADALDHKYFYYHGIADSEESLIGSGCNLSIHVEHFTNDILGSI